MASPNSNETGQLPDLRTATCPELLAPAGDFDCVRAAVENGADAVYFGLDHGFNARVRAANFALRQLPEIVSFLHRRGVKGYITLNTLIFADELAEVERTVRALASVGIDAVLVQDLGLATLVRELCPGLSIHASTQMTLTSAECIRVAETLGLERVVLARELSIDDIRKIRQQTDMPLEVFVHGALCVAYSGQCLTSESLGGRSANRGQCAQACRMPYDLICDGRDVDLGTVKYLLSPQDLAAFDLIPELIRAGVSSFKIEGRLKSPEYVANITRQYRRAIDEAWCGGQAAFTPTQVREMELSFSRGFSPGWLLGDDHKMLVPGVSSAKRGVRSGTITAIQRGRVLVQLHAPLATGDGVVFEGDREAQQEQGGRVFEIRQNGRPVTGPVEQGEVELAFQRGCLDVARLHVGQVLWKTDDPQLTARLRTTFRGPDPIRKIPLQIAVEAAVGQSLRVRGRAASGAVCDVQSDFLLPQAEKHPLTVEVLREQLGRLGGTVYELRELEAQIVGRPMAPLSILGAVRRELISQLDASVTNPPVRSIAEENLLDRIRQRNSDRNNVSHCDGTAELRVLCRSLSQLKQLLALNAKTIYVDFQDIREYRLAVRLAHEAGTEIYLATPRIQKPDEPGIFIALAKQKANGILVRNLSGLQFFRDRDIPVVADFSLNVTNDLTAQLLHDRGVQRVTTSYDLNREQLLELVQAVPAKWLEVVVHQHMPMFHMEHCVFCAVLSPGTNKTNCGRPCDHHVVHLRDRIGMEHPLTADVGCRNTLFNATPQSAAEVIPSLLQHGVRSFRIELLHESDSEIQQVFELYKQLIAGEVSGREVWNQLRAANRVGVTRGTLEERRNPLAIL